MKKRTFDRKHLFTRLKLLFCFVSLIWGFLGISLSSATTFYVSNIGSNNNPGTLDEPWLTICHAAAIAGPDDTPYVRAGIYNEEVYLERNGTACARIRFQAYPGETVILEGQETRRWGFRIYGAYNTVAGFTIRNYNRDGNRTMEDSHHIEVFNCTIHHIGWTDRNWNNGIHAASNSHHHNFSHNQIYDVYNHPISL